MSDETRYPIYKIGVEFTQDGEQESRSWWPADPGPGRIWDSLNHTMMYREDPGLDEVRRWAREEWWPEVVKTYRFQGVADEGIAVKLSHHETWCLTWFNHWTFDVGQTDTEALASFADYVQRYAHMQGSYPGVPLPEGYRCLMGAEDRWRWSGAPGSDRSPPPCRCDDCKAQGVIRIGH